MEKDICTRQFSREGLGCVWVFMNMFDFKHGGSNQKLLMDKKRGSKRIIGNIGIFETKVEKQLTCDTDCEEKEVGRQSVKKLIEEEIDEKKNQQCRDGTKAKNRKRRSSNDINVLIASDDDQCPRMSQNEVDSINDDSEEKFSELIKRLIAQKESETASCNKNPLDAFQVSLEKNSQCTETIVVLKPEPNSLEVSSSPGLDSTENKTKYGRFGSRFFLSRIRRRLNFGVGKSPPYNAQQDSKQDQDALSSNMSGEEIETNPGRRVSDGESLPEKEETIIRGSEEDSKKSTCGIYIAAKKHLSEMLAEGDIDVVDSPDKEVPRILGKILAFPEFSTPESSPRMTEKPMIQQCSSEDYYPDTIGLDTNEEEIASTSEMPVPIDTEKEEKTDLDALSEDNFDNYNEVEHKSQEPCSPPSSSVRISECQENATDVPGKSSPVSVLEPLFTDDELSPNSSRFSSGMTQIGEMRLQPLCIRFDEPDSSPRPDKENDVKTRIDDKELALAYIQEVVNSSELNWEELLSRSFYSEQLLEHALIDEISFCPTNLCSDKKLLFDCINEVLEAFCGQGPWISFLKPPALRFLQDMENVTEVVQEEVYWHLLPLPSPHTLDQVVQKDLARTGKWMDLRFDIGCIGSETGELILDELLEEIISNFTMH